MSSTDLEIEIRKIIHENPGNSNSKLMEILIKSLKGKADNRTIKEIFDKIIK